MALQWNPGVYDRSGEILGRATVGAAETKREGMNQLAQGIASGVTSLAGAAMDAYGAAAQKGQMANEVIGRAQAIDQMGQQFGLDTTMLPALMQEYKGKPEAMKAFLDVYEGALGHGMKVAQMDHQLGNSMALANHKAATGAVYGSQQPASPARQPWQPFAVAPGIDMSR